MSVRTLFIDRRPRGRCRLLRTRARPVHFRDVRRPRPVGSSPGGLHVPFVCLFAGLPALWATVLFFPKRHPTVSLRAYAGRSRAYDAPSQAPRLSFGFSGCRIEVAARMATMPG